MIIRREDIWLWVLIGVKQKHLALKLGGFNHDEFDVAEATITFEDVADNEAFIRSAADILGLSDEE